MSDEQLLTEALSYFNEVIEKQPFNAAEQIQRSIAASLLVIARNSDPLRGRQHDGESIFDFKARLRK